MALHRFNPGECRRDCGSSGVTIECPCTPPCAAGTARNQYDVQWSIPGGGPYPPGFSGSERLAYVRQEGGCCLYEGSDTHDVCGVDCYAQFLLCGSTATILLRAVADDTPKAYFNLETILGSTDCSGTYSLSAGGATAGCGNVPLATASAEGVGTEEPPCIETPYTIPANPNSCCPCTDCRLLRDDFNRTAGTDLGANWTETAGQWTLEAPSRLATDDTSAIVLATTSASAVGIAVTAKGSSGDKIRLIAGYQDSSNYFYAEFTWGTGVIEIYERAGGTDTLLQEGTGTLAADEYARIFFCLDGAGDMVARTTAGAGVYVTVTGNAPSGSQYGLGTGATNSGNVQFALFESYVISADCESCVALIEHIGCGCAECCCQQQDETYEYEVDLGAGGLSNSNCANCAAVSGVFVVTRTGTGCIWQYVDNQFCTQTCDSDPGCSDYWTLAITLTRQGAFTCRWHVEVTLAVGCTSSGESGCGVHSTTFADAYEDNGEPCAGSWTLSRVLSIETATKPCTGTLPSTIGLASV